MSGFEPVQQSWQVLWEQSPRGSYARRRAAAVSAAAVFFLGLLAVFGLGRLLLLAVGIVVVLTGAAAGVRLVSLHRPWRQAAAVAGRTARELRRARGRVGRPALLDTAAGTARRRAQAVVVVAGKSRRELRPRLRSARGRLVRPVLLDTAAGSARRRVEAFVLAAEAGRRELRPSIQRIGERVGKRLEHAPRPRLARPEPAPVDAGRQAIELNVHGTRLRREGAYEQAAQQHQAALEIFRALGDRRGEALTLNNVALAEGRAGEEQTAVAHFEEALAILRELADREYEAQVTANLGLTLRRQGHGDRARELLESALEQLAPESTAARQLEVQLRRAS